MTHNSPKCFKPPRLADFSFSKKDHVSVTQYLGRWQREINCFSWMMLIFHDVMWNRSFSNIKNPLVWSKQHTSLGPTLFHFQLWLDLVFKVVDIAWKVLRLATMKGRHPHSVLVSGYRSQCEGASIEIIERCWHVLFRCVAYCRCVVIVSFPVGFARYKPDRCHHCRVAFGRDAGGSLSTEQEMLWKCYKHGDNSHKSERSNNSSLRPWTTEPLSSDEADDILWLFSSGFQTTADTLKAKIS